MKRYPSQALHMHLIVTESQGTLMKIRVPLSLIAMRFPARGKQRYAKLTGFWVDDYSSAYSTNIKKLKYQQNKGLVFR